MKKCLYCAEEIQDDAIKCRYCKSDLIYKTENRFELKPETIDKNKFGCGSALLGFLLPIVGILFGIIWLTNEEDRDRAWPMIAVSILGIIMWVIII